MARVPEDPVTGEYLNPWEEAKMWAEIRAAKEDANSQRRKHGKAVAEEVGDGAGPPPGHDETGGAAQE